MAKINKESRTYRMTKFAAFVLRFNWKQLRGLFMALNMGVGLSLLYKGQCDWQLAIAVWAMPCLLYEMVVMAIFAAAKHGAVATTVAKLDEHLDALYTWFKVVE